MSTDIRDTNDLRWLAELRTTLADELEVQKARLTELTDDTGDPAEDHTRVALLAATRQSVEQVSGALRRLADGTYGTCEQCGASIPRERLEILPHARFCMPCQRRHNG
ncbi:TraR/DksA C4-type zinc finger protein [Dactylosporangium roseum]|uniref:TraR/DksA C4-type zinc finger protein n=1 Tax=Dactylosporangium roseum TaxID=47989 RepID=A0ABY5YYE2_9ACTN|nr:TraR/DksA C4-type zinc finger protein [Dactylosporangium roseum]UWZ33883.1 TraR/DksA C4-type zinc finger protein [Dactylosporangium roseum]